MNQLKKLFAVAALTACVLPVAAQYPVIPDSVKIRGEEQQKEIDRKSDEAWAKALPVVMSEAAQGRPYKPWASKPEDLIKSNIPAFPGAEGGGAYTPGGRGGKVIVVNSLADSGPGTLREACETGGARISERTNFDIEMLKETGFCSGIENYSRHLAGLPAGATPHTLMDYFKDDYLIIVDESHITIPQIRGMYAGDQSRKSTLVDYGFRLPSAKDNRPLNFEEFESKIDQMLFVSATPNVYEDEHELLRTEQIIRPTGLLDPEVVVRPVEGQIDDLIGEVNKEIKDHHKVLITTLTKKMAEDLTDYMREIGIRVKYLHSDIDTLERAEIIRDLRLDVFDVLVGINLLREGLDIPEITLVAILDADKEGFLRSETSLIQTIGRAARNSEGHVIMYADKITDSMRVAIEETKRRREIQQAYNEEHGITPTTIQKSVRELISVSKKVAKEEMNFKKDPESMNRDELTKLIADIQKKMQKAAADLNFEAAAEYRDKMVELKSMLRDM